MLWQKKKINQLSPFSMKHLKCNVYSYLCNYLVWQGILSQAKIENKRISIK